MSPFKLVYLVCYMVSYVIRYLTLCVLESWCQIVCIFILQIFFWFGMVWQDRHVFTQRKIWLWWKLFLCLYDNVCDWWCVQVCGITIFLWLLCYLNKNCVIWCRKHINCWRLCYCQTRQHQCHLWSEGSKKQILFFWYLMFSPTFDKFAYQLLP